MSALLLSAPADLTPTPSGNTLDRMMVELLPDSVRASAAIRDVYRDYVDALRLDGYRDIKAALSTGGLAPLPPDSSRFNVIPRLDGLNPIGEKNLVNQSSYLAARPATIGCLMEIASRVRSGPLEITSLVRDADYQEALRTTNANATTSIPMHTLGLAFDIALMNTPLPTVYEIRDVLRQMQDEGALLFIGERHQLVFHVVPHPSRLGDFMRVYAKAFGTPSAARAAEVTAPSMSPIVAVPRIFEVPRVRTEVIAALIPETAVHSAAAADRVGVVGTSGTRAEEPARRSKPPAISRSVMLSGFTFFGTLLTTAWWVRRRT